jgi:hypothetical protein
MNCYSSMIGLMLYLEVKKDYYGFILVNFSQLIHKEDEMENEPFIFTLEATEELGSSK